jgi:hypothetical protein
MSKMPHQQTRRDKAHNNYAESVVPDSSVVCTDAPSCLILAAVAPALFPRKRFRISSLERKVIHDRKKDQKGDRQGSNGGEKITMPRLHSNVARRRERHSSGSSSM